MELSSEQDRITISASAYAGILALTRPTFGGDPTHAAYNMGQEDIKAQVRRLLLPKEMQLEEKIGQHIQHVLRTGNVE